jgi:hypothetical protein
MAMRTGKELSYGWCNVLRFGVKQRCRCNSSEGKSANPRSRRQHRKADFELSISSRLWALRVQATDSVSRSREEITVETPSPRMLIPYSASAISIVRFW